MQNEFLKLFNVTLAGIATFQPIAQKTEKEDII
jgi:hypothetical protein